MDKATLDRIQLSSTSGTICVELVKKIEMTGTRIVEISVTHRPRLYGRSQFFRLKSLATTLGQLLALHRQLVVKPWLLKMMSHLTGIRRTQIDSE